jgi:uncharacterized protein YbjT (DUF2867 family)
MTKSLHAVTGAFGYSGQYIARRLLGNGHEVITLTNSIDRTNSFEGRVKAYPFNFNDPDKLAESLQGVSVLYNTYWVRFDHKGFSHSGAVQNTQTLFQAAKKAGVERIVHVSITNPTLDSPLDYFRGKAELERDLEESGVSYAILRPTVLFGKEDILINNIAWSLRRFPVFGLFGMGRYRIQPVYVDDLAKLAVDQGESRNNVVVNAVGPETFTFGELAHAIAKTIKVRRFIVPMPPLLAYLACTVIGKMVGDVFITRAEVKGLMGDLLHVDTPPTGETSLTNWMEKNADRLGKRYASELARRRDRKTDYGSL